MKPKIEIGVRYLLALLLGVFGASKFVHFLPTPELPPEAGAFFGALGNAGYIFPAIGIVFLVVALLLAVNRWVAFGLILLAPITFHIIAYHLRFDLPGLAGPGALLLILQLALVVLHWDDFKPLFKK